MKVVVRQEPTHSYFAAAVALPNLGSQYVGLRFVVDFPVLIGHSSRIASPKNCVMLQAGFASARPVVQRNSADLLFRPSAMRPRE